MERSSFGLFWYEAAYPPRGTVQICWNHEVIDGTNIHLIQPRKQSCHCQKGLVLPASCFKLLIYLHDTWTLQYY